MLRFYLWLTLLPLTLIAAVLLLIHAQPYDDHDLRQLLLPDGCPAPCFMGIRPGITTADEVVTILQANQWVADVNKRGINNKYGFITWTWNDRRPAWTSPKAVGEILLTDKKVHAITIASALVLGETRLTLGLPDAEFIGTPQDPNDKSILYEGFYLQYGLITRSWQTCDVTEPLRKTVVITVVEPDNTRIRGSSRFNDVFRRC